MSCYGVHGYGLYLNWDEAIAFCKNYAKANNYDFDIDPEEDDFEEDMYVTDVGNSVGYVLNNNFYDMRNITLLSKINEGPADALIEYTEGLFLASDRQGYIITDPERTYKSLSDMALEFKERCSQYLPADFNYEGHLAEFLGSYD